MKFVNAMTTASLDKLLGVNYGYPAQVKRFVIKWGTASFVKDATSYQFDEQKVKNAAKTLYSLKRRKREVVAVVSGAVVKGMEKEGLTERPAEVGNRQYLAAKGQALLIGMFNEALKPYDITAAQALLTRQNFATQTERKNIQQQFEHSFKDKRGIYICNTNDVVATEELLYEFVMARPGEADYRLMSVDNDSLAVLVAECTSAKALVMVSDPERSNGVGSGGGESKLNAAARAAESNIYVSIVSPAQLSDLLKGSDVGSKFLPVEWGSKPTLKNIGLEAYVSEEFLSNAKRAKPDSINRRRALFTVENVFPKIIARSGRDRLVTATYSITPMQDSLFYRLSLRGVTA